MHNVTRRISKELTPERIVFLSEKIKEVEIKLGIHHHRMKRGSIRIKAIKSVYTEYSIWDTFRITQASFTELVSIVLSEIPKELITLFGEREKISEEKARKENFEEWQSRTPWRKEWLNGEIRGTFDH